MATTRLIFTATPSDGWAVTICAVGLRRWLVYIHRTTSRNFGKSGVGIHCREQDSAGGGERKEEREGPKQPSSPLDRIWRLTAPKNSRAILSIFEQWLLLFVMFVFRSPFRVRVQKTIRSVV